MLTHFYVTKTLCIDSTLLHKFSCYPLSRCASCYVPFTLGVVFAFDVINGGVRDGDGSVNCRGARKSELS